MVPSQEGFPRQKTSLIPSLHPNRAGVGSEPLWGHSSQLGFPGSRGKRFTPAPTTPASNRAGQETAQFFWKTFNMRCFTYFTHSRPLRYSNMESNSIRAPQGTGHLEQRGVVFSPGLESSLSHHKESLLLGNEERPLWLEAYSYKNPE